MKYYSALIKQRVKAGPNTLGLQLARLAILRGISIKEIAYLLGASRMTVYNWYSGKNITNAYIPRVKQLINIFKTAPDGDAAWETACTAMGIHQ
jgi:predicted transcriptional regulator